MPDTTLQEERRYLIVGPGRTGSSLLAAILSEAGADFGLSPGGSWDPRAGAYEHPLLHEAYRWHRWAHRTRDTALPDRFFRRSFERRRNKRLSTLFAETPFAKSTQLVWLVRPVEGLGFQPVILVSFRPFAAHARSSFRKSGEVARKIVDSYKATYETALLQLEIYGGCLVSYDEVMDPQEEEWADGLSAVTGLSRWALLDARGSLAGQTARDSSGGPGTGLFADEVVGLERACLKLANIPLSGSA